LRVARAVVVAFIGPNGAGKNNDHFHAARIASPDAWECPLIWLPAGSLEVRRRVGFQSEIFYTYGFKTRNNALRFYGELSEMPEDKIDRDVPRQLDRLGSAQRARAKSAIFQRHDPAARHRASLAASTGVVDSR